MAFLSERTEKNNCLKTHIAYDAMWSTDFKKHPWIGEQG